jgi:hypothetical protein
MTRLEAWLLHASNALVGGTGLVYGWMRYALKPEDPYSVVGHPLQPDVQHLHVLFAPLLVFACGVVWQAHVWAGLRNHSSARRRSGLFLTATMIPMIASGYAIQIAVGEGWRAVWIAVHVASSSLWIAAYLAHQGSAVWRRLSLLLPHPALPGRPSRG